MTSNQIAYWNHWEGSRHNKVVEQETKRHNVATERLESAKIALGYAQLAETNRSNLANESIKRDTLSETQTHNRVTEATTSVHYTSMDSETARHNRILEDIQRRETMLEQAKLGLQREQFDWNRIIDTHSMINEYLDTGGDLIKATAASRDSKTRKSKAIADTVMTAISKIDEIGAILALVG